MAYDEEDMFAHPREDEEEEQYDEFGVARNVSEDDYDDVD